MPPCRQKFVNKENASMSLMGPETVKARTGGGGGGLPLSLALTPNLRTRPILDGMFHADGIQMTPLELHPSELFWRQLKFAEFDVSEMSMSSMLMLIASGDDRFIGLPIFSTHYFFQNWILIRKDAGIEKPEDLAGKASWRAGIPTNRGALVSRNSGTRIRCGFWAIWNSGWNVRRISAMADPPDLEPPEGVTVHRIPAETNMGEMLLAKELDATLLYLPGGNLVDRSTTCITTPTLHRYSRTPMRRAKGTTRRTISTPSTTAW